MVNGSHWRRARVVVVDHVSATTYTPAVLGSPEILPLLGSIVTRRAARPP
jgi:hypothetical protein